jgi:hypothetical protein
MHLIATNTWLDRLANSRAYLALFPFVVVVLFTLLARQVRLPDREHLGPDGWLLYIELCAGAVVATPALVALRLARFHEANLAAAGFLIIVLTFVAGIWLAQMDRVRLPERRLKEGWFSRWFVGTIFPNMVASIPILALFVLAPGLAK